MICVVKIDYVNSQLALVINWDRATLESHGGKEEVERYFESRQVIIKVDGTDLPQKGWDYVLIDSEILFLCDLGFDFYVDTYAPMFIVGEEFVSIHDFADLLKHSVREMKIAAVRS